MNVSKSTLYLICHGPLLYLQSEYRLDILVPKVTGHSYNWATLSSSGVQRRRVEQGDSADLINATAPAGAGVLKRVEMVVLKGRSRIVEKYLLARLQLSRPGAIRSLFPATENVKFLGGDGTGQPMRPRTLQVFQFDGVDLASIQLADGLEPPVELPGLGIGVAALVGGPENFHTHSAAEAFNEMIQVLGDTDLQMATERIVSEDTESTTLAVELLVKQALKRILMEALGGLGSRDCLGCGSDLTTE